MADDAVDPSLAARGTPSRPRAHSSSDPVIVPTPGGDALKARVQDLLARYDLAPVGPTWDASAADCLRTLLTRLEALEAEKEDAQAACHEWSALRTKERERAEAAEALRDRYLRLNQALVQRDTPQESRTKDGTITRLTARVQELDDYTGRLLEGNEVLQRTVNDQARRLVELERLVAESRKPKPCPHGNVNGCSWCDLRDDGGLPEAQAVENADHCACQHDGRGNLTNECQEHEEVRVERDRLRRAIGNCYMMAKRRISALARNGYTVQDTEYAAYAHIMRFCEEVGCKSDILRWQLPTEITDGGS